MDVDGRDGIALLWEFYLLAAVPTDLLYTLSSVAVPTDLLYTLSENGQKGTVF